MRECLFVCVFVYVLALTHPYTHIYVPIHKHKSFNVFMYQTHTTLHSICIKT